MRHIVRDLTTVFDQAIQDEWPQAGLMDSIELTTSHRPALGHLQSTMPLRLAKAMDMQPLLIAQRLADICSGKHESIDKINVSKPGFINLRLHHASIAQALLADDITVAEFKDDSKTVLIDYSSPNIAKAMHVGHLRSTIIGDSLSRIASFLGHHVLRVNHIGDWGTSFGMLIAFIQKQGIQIDEDTSLETLTAYYRQARDHFEQQDVFADQCHQALVRLQSKDEASMALWEQLCRISLKGFQVIYDALGITPLEVRGESAYADDLPKIIKALDDVSLLRMSDGCACVFLPGFVTKENSPLPLIVQKSDGGFNYATTDLAALRYRANVIKANRVIYVTDRGQSLHFSMIFETAKQADWIAPNQQFEHVDFGLVLDQAGKKFKTRSGQTVALHDLIDAATDHAYDVVNTKRPEMDETQRAILAKKLAINAIKYADLSNNRKKDYRYDPDRMMALEGNTAGFLMYAQVRMHSLIRKAHARGILPGQMILEHDSEVNLALTCLIFMDKVTLSYQMMMPHVVAEYAYGLVQQFNAFFRDCPVIGDPKASSRLALVINVHDRLLACMTMLGLQTTDVM